MRMDFTGILKPDLEGEKTEAVTEANTARALGSGGLAVYGTPAMIALMEKASLAAVDPLLPAGYSTVGTELDAKHIAATALGMHVSAKAKLLSINGRELVFNVQAFDEAGKIGEATHKRFIVENERFMAKAAAKKA